jgi:hypothetical protein
MLSKTGIVQKFFKPLYFNNLLFAVFYALLCDDWVELGFVEIFTQIENNTMK